MRGSSVLLIGVVGVGAVVGLRAPVSPGDVSPRKIVASAPVSATPAPGASATLAVANRPGEPMLVPGGNPGVTLQRAANGHFFADATINGQAVPMLVDTGATTVALTVADAQRLGLPIDPTRSQVVGSGASGPTRGQTVMLNDVAIGDHHAGPMEAVVLEGLGESLLGQAYLGRLQMQVNGDTMTLR